jgi:hypothetical protein
VREFLALKDGSLLRVVSVDGELVPFIGCAEKPGPDAARAQAEPEIVTAAMARLARKRNAYRSRPTFGGTPARKY